jgi:hypothetical protein
VAKKTQTKHGAAKQVSFRQHRITEFFGATKLWRCSVFTCKMKDILLLLVGKVVKREWGATLDFVSIYIASGF